MDLKPFNKFIHSQWMAILGGAVTAGGTAVACVMGPVNPSVADTGMLFPSANLWIAQPYVSAAVSVALTIGLAILINVLNRTFNLQTSPTLFDSTLFLLMSLAAPTLMMHLSTGTVLCAVVMLCLFILFNVYGNSYASYQIFSIFLLLSVATMIQYGMLWFLPVFIVGTIQMRALTSRTLVAMLLGIITPWWIVFGFGLASPMAVRLPDWQQFLRIDLQTNAWLLTTVAVSTGLMIVAWVGNFPRMIAYNAHRRAYNGTMSVLSLVTLLAIICDSGHCSTYAPMLFVCASVQLGKFLSGRLNNFGLTAALSIVILFILIYLCYPISFALL